MPPRILDDKQLVEVCELYMSGQNSTAIAEKYKITADTIQRWLKRKGIQVRKSGDSLRAKLNEHFFDVIDTEIKAYWLGFLIADGCISKSAGSHRALRFYVAAKDRQVIEQFALDIEYKGKIHTPYNSITNKIRNQYGICFNSPIICNSLIAKGFLDWKRGVNERLFVCVPDSLMHHFIRGFFDGDGCISGDYFNFSANKAHIGIMSRLEAIIADKCGFRVKGPKVRITSVNIGWNGRLQLIKFAEFIYKGATRFLQRKKIRFDALKYPKLCCLALLMYLILIKYNYEVIW